MNKQAFGNFFRQKRIEHNLTLRAYCNRYGYDTAYISRIENCKLKPPTSEKLKALIETLGLQQGTKEWVTLFDLAHQARNELPEDIKKTAPEIIGMLPAFLRTNDGKKISKRRIDELIKFLQKDGRG